MTKQELIKMTGSEEQANYALEIVLKQLKTGFVQECIRAELKQIEEQIAELQNEGAIYSANGMLHANANPGNDSFYKANGLLYTHNRLLSLLCVR